MPIEGFHTARQMDPGNCDKIRRQEVTAGVSFNYCVIRGKAEVQSVHFDARKFSVDEAKAWLKAHDFKADQFEPAAGTMANAEAPLTEIRCGYSGGEAFEYIAAQAGGSDLPRVTMLAYTGVPIKLDGFHLQLVVDLESLIVPRSQKVPILRSHDAERIAGHSESIDVTPQRLKAAGVLSGLPEHTADITATAGRGFPWQVSIGAQQTKRTEHIPAGESINVNGRRWPGPLLVARGARLRELSLLPMGADGNTDAGFSAG